MPPRRPSSRTIEPCSRPPGRVSASPVFEIDYDFPTSSLATYGTFLRELRQELPASQLLSITALLDWFGPRTAIADTVKWVDEFVPQFYDTAHERMSGGIAEPIDALKWAPVFNAYRVPYRIGISSFGRIARRRSTGRAFDGSLLPRRESDDFAGRRQFVRSVRATSAGELVVHLMSRRWKEALKRSLSCSDTTWWRSRFLLKLRCAPFPKRSGSSAVTVPGSFHSGGPAAQKR